MNKNMKMKKRKHFNVYALLWVATITALVFLITISIVNYSNYKKGQDLAVASTFAASGDKFSKSDYVKNPQKVISEMYDFYTPFYYTFTTSNGTKISNRNVVDSARDADYALGDVLEENGFECSLGSEYLEHTSFISYIADSKSILYISMCGYIIFVLILFGIMSVVKKRIKAKDALMDSYDVSKEKSIIEGQFLRTNKFTVMLLVFSVVSFVVSILIWDNNESYFEHLIMPESAEGIAVFFWLSIAIVLVSVYLMVQMEYCKINVSEKRVFGKTAFGRKTDLPFDKISAIGNCFPNGIVVSTSSGKLKFWLLSNQKEVYECISDLLNKRQENKDTIIGNLFNADELKKYKDLLDSGVISQEEFDAKKKQFLGL